MCNKLELICYINPVELIMGNLSKNNELNLFWLCN